MPTVTKETLQTDHTKDEASIDVRKDVGKGPKGEVQFWVKELDIAWNREQDYRKEGTNVWDRYRYDDRKEGIKKFNILWSNTEVQRPMLFSAVPNPDVRRRFRDRDKIGKESAEILERAIAFSIDAYDIEDPLGSAVLDYLLPGRGVVRVKYIPTFQMSNIEVAGVDEKGDETVETIEQEQLVFEETLCEHVKWNNFLYGYADRWKEVPWVAFKHELKRDELKKFPNFADADKIELDQTTREEKDEETTDEHGDSFRRLLVWEIWDKEKREVVFVAPSYEEGPLHKEPDPLGLEEFFPTPKPAIMVGGTLLPIPEYRQYQDQAEELDEITARINGIVRAIKARGVYDSTLEEFARLMEAGDNTLVPAKNAMQYIERGGLANAIWMMPVDMLASVLVILSQQRETIKQEIFEIIGISDILRGQSDPNETLGAQRIKTNFGSSRIQEKQRAIQNYIRDVYRIKAEIIAEKFQPQTLQLMTGKQITPEIMQLLRQDVVRNYRIDVETDSTVQGVLQEEQKNITELLGGIATFTQAVTPAVQSGAIPQDVAKTILMSAVRRFKMGREVEDALEQIEGDGQNQQAQIQQLAQQMAEQIAAQNVEVINAQREAQADAAKQQQELTKTQGELKIKAGDLQLKQQELAFAQQKHDDEIKLELLKHKDTTDLKREEIIADLAIKKDANDDTLAVQMAQLRNKDVGASKTSTRNEV